MMLKYFFILSVLAIGITFFGCGSDVTSNVEVKTNSNTNSNTVREIRLDPANMPPGLSGNAIPMSANLPPGISLNTNIPLSGKKIPGIPTEEEMKKGFKIGKTPIPGIPDQETIRRQLGSPVSNTNAPPANSVPMMKGNRRLGGKP